MFVYELFKAVDANQIVSILQLNDDGENWKGKFYDWVRAGVPMACLTVMKVYYSDESGLTMEVW